MNCPNLQGVRNSVSVCKENEGRPCIYETGSTESCPILLEIMKEEIEATLHDNRVEVKV